MKRSIALSVFAFTVLGSPAAMAQPRPPGPPGGSWHGPPPPGAWRGPPPGGWYGAGWGYRPVGPGWYGPGWSGGWYGGWWGPRLGVTVAGPWGWPYAYPYPYPVYTNPAVVVVPQTVPMPYVEQTPGPQAQPQQPAQVLWFYCTDPAGYYPYVQQCNRTWQPVRPQDVQPAPR